MNIINPFPANNVGTTIASHLLLVLLLTLLLPPQHRPRTSFAARTLQRGPYLRYLRPSTTRTGRKTWKMTSESKENVSGFIIQGFSDTPELQISLFVLFLGIYLIILLGNLIVFLVISCNPHLHTPMYIFLLNLSLIDISSTTNTLPKLLHILLTQQHNISFLGCMTQMFVFVALAASEYLLLTAMAYDRYVAICDPLHYIARMSRKHCAGLITAAFTVGFVEPIGLVVLMSKLSYCASHLINHFFCDMASLLQLSCSSTFSVELLIFIEGTLLLFNSFLPTLISYISIISAILKIQSSEGRQKAFSTCASHLACVITLYGTAICLYMRPTTSYSLERDKYFSLLYIVLGPVLNPLIYTLKNREFQSSLNKIKQKWFSISDGRNVSPGMDLWRISTFRHWQMVL
uniref:G-protein coupled receptors family 1 profile domain-containing protein n=1 Tax=Xenopus tropicalis TaxID=8364 RepID=A0A803K8Z4_XENTR